MFSIGEFSKVTGLTVKTLRFYHDEGLLVPSFVDPNTGYRYYNENQLEVARVISYLRGLDFPLADIREILGEHNDNTILDAMERQKDALNQKLGHLRKTVRSLNQFISEERNAMKTPDTAFDIQEKPLDALTIASVRMKGHYSECGKGFAKIGRAFGRHICSQAFLLHHDSEYKEGDADFEACMPVRQTKAVDGIVTRQLAPGRCVALMHKGPYDQLGRAYAKVLKYVIDKGYRIAMPTREVYVKGPGMIFKGNPKNYLTEIQIPIEGSAG